MHRRSRRYFNDFDIGIVLTPDGLQGHTHCQRDFMACPIAFVFWQKVDLNIAHIGAAAQIILPYQPIEIDGRGASSIGLIIGDFRHRGEVPAQFTQHMAGLLQAGPFRHVDHHLELRLVIKWQHLQNHQFDPDQADRQQNQQQHNPRQFTPFGPTHLGIQKGTEIAFEDCVELIFLARFILRMSGAGQKLVRQPGSHHKRDHQRDQHADTGVYRDWAHIRPHQASDKCHG